jgi:tetratricopeptide (TPR) repeat protein
MNRGFMKHVKGLLDDAIADFKKAVELDPKSAKARTSLGSGKQAKGLVDEAIEDYTKAIELDPTDMMPYYNRGTLKYGKGLHDEAIADFTKAIEREPGMAAAYLNRGNSKLAKGLPDEAIADYTRAIEKDSKYARAYTNRGNVKQSKGLEDEAIADWEKALEVAPPGWPQRAELEDRIRSAAAPRLFQEATKLHEQKRYREAIEKFKSLIDAHPKAAQALASAYNIACGYALLGETSNALDWLQKTVDLGFTNIAGMEGDADLKSLRGEERYHQLVEKLKKK